MNKQRWSGKVENVGQICYGHFLTTFISCGQNNVVVVVVDLSVHEPSGLESVRKWNMHVTKWIYLLENQPDAVEPLLSTISFLAISRYRDTLISNIIYANQ